MKYKLSILKIINIKSVCVYASVSNLKLLYSMVGIVMPKANRNVGIKCTKAFFTKLSSSKNKDFT
jgi:hypothetical protein